MTSIRSEIKRRLTRLMRPVTWRNLRSTKPVSAIFGLERGLPVDRYYIEDFLGKNSDCIHGAVLEIAESTYSRKFGKEQDAQFHVLHFSHDNPQASLVGDLTDVATLPKNKFDCFICTQTYNFIYDFKKAIQGSHHLLKEGGVLLATVGGISQISTYDMVRWGDYWRFTTLSALQSVEEVFGKGQVEVKSYGNVLSAVAFLEGISPQELKKEELDYRDENYQLLITIKAIK